MDYLENMRLRLEGEESYVPAWLGDKRAVREFGRIVGVRTPEILFRGRIAELPDDLVGRFVLKPEFASTSLGVHILESVDVNSYRTLTNDGRIARSELLEKCNSVSQRYFESAEDPEATFVAEQLLVGHDGSFPPPDIRFYSFQGEIGLILLEHHLSGVTESMYFDGNFHPFQDRADRYSIDKKAQHLESIVPAVPPSGASDLLQVARRISVAVPSAFCRIDLYDTPAGIFLGELTFYPGTFYYRNRKLMSQEESQRLGRLWDAALDRLGGSVRCVTKKSDIRL